MLNSKKKLIRSQIMISTSSERNNRSPQQLWIRTYSVRKTAVSAFRDLCDDPERNNGALYRINIIIIRKSKL